MALCAQILEGLVQLTICGDSLEILHPDREILLVAVGFPVMSPLSIQNQRKHVNLMNKSTPLIDIMH